MMSKMVRQLAIDGIALVVLIVSFMGTLVKVIGASDWRNGQGRAIERPIFVVLSSSQRR